MRRHPLLRLVLSTVVIAVGMAGESRAGPPYLTDDPEPTDPGHWEVYNFAADAGGAGGLSGEAGFDVNYGAAKDLQLTAVIPLGFENSAEGFGPGFRGGPGALELAAKYRFLRQADGGWAPDVSLFPRILVPLSPRFGPERANLFMPLWAEKDFGPWSMFGGGGYEINPGPAQHGFWQGGLAVSRALGPRVSLGAEVFAQTASSLAGGGFTAADFGGSLRLTRHWSLLASAGPTWEQAGRRGQVAYLALKADY